MSHDGNLLMATATKLMAAIQGEPFPPADFAPGSARPDKEVAAAHGVPSFLRKYAKRYGVAVDEIVATHLKNRHVGMLDHGRDKTNAFRKAYGLPPL